MGQKVIIRYRRNLRYRLCYSRLHRLELLRQAQANYGNSGHLTNGKATSSNRAHMPCSLFALSLYRDKRTTIIRLWWLSQRLVITYWHYCVCGDCRTHWHHLSGDHFIYMWRHLLAATSASRNHLTNFCRSFVHYACLKLCSAKVHFIRNNCLYFVC